MLIILPPLPPSSVQASKRNIPGVYVSGVGGDSCTLKNKGGGAGKNFRKVSRESGMTQTL